MPAVSSASVAAQSASGSTRETCLRSFFSTQASSSKSVTSPAICTGIPEASKREMRLIPLRPASRALEKAARPTPLGLTAPIPVMTQRRFISTSHIRKYQEWDSYGVFFESKVGHFSDLVDRGCCSNPQSLVTNFLVKPPLQSFFIQVPHSKAEIKLRNVSQLPYPLGYTKNNGVPLGTLFLPIPFMADQIEIQSIPNSFESNFHLL